MRTKTLVLAALLSLAAVALAACGGGDGDGKPALSSTSAAQMRGSLDAIESQVQAGNCTGAAQQASALETLASDLTDRVDTDLRDALAEGAGRLRTLIEDRCGQTTTETTTTPPVTETTPTDEGDDEKNKKPKKDKPEKPGQGPPEGTTDEVPTTPEGTTDGGTGGAGDVPFGEE